LENKKTGAGCNADGGKRCPSARQWRVRQPTLLLAAESWPQATC